MPNQDKEIKVVEVNLEQFAGLITNRGPLFGPPTAAEVQKNFVVHGEGLLEIRAGIRPVTFEN